MDQLIVYVDDAEHAKQQIAPLRLSGSSRPVAPAPDPAAAAAVPPAAAGAGGSATHWVLVACPPHLPGSASKWVPRQAREDWRQQWAEQLFAELRPLFSADENQRLTAVLATGELTRLTEKLLAEHGQARILDARRPKFGVDLAPVSDGQAPPSAGWKWQIPAALAGLGALLVLGAE